MYQSLCKPTHYTELTTSEPMQIDGTHLTPQERQRRRRDHLCCGGADHIGCPARNTPRRSALAGARSQPQVSIAFISPSVTICSTGRAYLANQSNTVLALIDSGSAGNFLDYTLARNFWIPFINLSSPLAIQTIDAPSGKGPLCTVHLSGQPAS